MGKEAKCKNSIGKNSLIEVITRNCTSDIRETSNCLNRDFPGINFKKLPGYNEAIEALKKYKNAVKIEIIKYTYKK